MFDSTNHPHCSFLFSPWFARTDKDRAELKRELLRRMVANDPQLAERTAEQMLDELKAGKLPKELKQ